MANSAIPNFKGWDVHMVCYYSFVSKSEQVKLEAMKGLEKLSNWDQESHNQRSDRE